MVEALVVESLTFNASWSSAEVNGAEHKHAQVSTQHTHDPTSHASFVRLTLRSAYVLFGEIRFDDQE